MLIYYLANCMCLNKEKPGSFIWFSTLQCRHFGRESISYSSAKLVGKFLPNPQLGYLGFEEPGQDENVYFILLVVVEKHSFSQSDHWGRTLLVAFFGEGFRHLIIHFHHHGCDIKPFAVLAEHFTKFGDVPRSMHLTSPAHIT